MDMSDADQTQKNISTREQFATFLLAAFGFVAGLAWNDAVQSLIKAIFPLSTGSVWAKFVYAIAATIFLVVVTRWVGRSGTRD